MIYIFLVPKKKTNQKIKETYGDTATSQHEKESL